jgi:hypothetical protein
MVLANLTSAETDARLAVCRSCEEYIRDYRCKKCELGCRNRFRNNLETVDSKCPLKKW